MFACFHCKKQAEQKKHRRAASTKRKGSLRQPSVPKDVSRTNSTRVPRPDSFELTNVGETPSLSMRSEGEVFFDCKDEFSSEGGLSPRHSYHSCSSPTRTQSGTPRALDGEVCNGHHGLFADSKEGQAPSEAEEPSDDAGALEDDNASHFSLMMSCLPKLHKVTSSGSSFSGERPGDRVDKEQRTLSSRLAHRTSKPLAGASLMRRDASVPVEEARECWEDCDATTFRVRSVDYMRTKLKVPSSKALYRLLAVDFFTFPSKVDHIAEMVTLPNVQCPYLDQNEPTVAIPPLLIFNLQLPTYAPTLFGNTDGPGHSIVYYFQLPEDFHPEKVENQLFLQMFERFVANGREADGTPTRDRLKIIPRVANPEEWLNTGPLSATEFKLLKNYNEKPVMTKPQHRFFVGPNYLEVDLDVHTYAYLAKRALVGFMSRLSTVVWDNAFVLQGNTPEELPEQVLACTRVHQVDFVKDREWPFPAA